MPPSAAKETNSDSKTAVSDESILKIAKEITVKFIEVGRITPASFNDDFINIHATIEAAARKEKS